MFRINFSFYQSNSRSQCIDTRWYILQNANDSRAFQIVYLFIGLVVCLFVRSKPPPLSPCGLCRHYWRHWRAHIHNSAHVEAEATGFGQHKWTDFRDSNFG